MSYRELPSELAGLIELIFEDEKLSSYFSADEEAQEFYRQLLSAILDAYLAGEDPDSIKSRIMYITQLLGEGKEWRLVLREVFGDHGEEA